MIIAMAVFWLHGGCGEFDLYPHHGISRIHQGKVREKEGILFPRKASQQQQKNV